MHLLIKIAFFWLLAAGFVSLIKYIFHRYRFKITKPNIRIITVATASILIFITIILWFKGLTIFDSYRLNFRSCVSRATVKNVSIDRKELIMAYRHGISKYYDEYTYEYEFRADDGIYYINSATGTGAIPVELLNSYFRKKQIDVNYLCQNPSISQILNAETNRFEWFIRNVLLGLVLLILSAVLIFLGR
jgi:hypothetical protein